MALKLGCTADDFTGATDLANNLVRAGMRVVQTIGAPSAEAAVDADVDAIVVALKPGNFGGTGFFSRAFEILN
jgi:3-dehydrotetronate 4-kinase